MGQDKATLLFRHQPLLLHQIESLWDLGLEEVVVALGRSRSLPFPLPVPTPEDVFPDKGPLAGIHAGLLSIRAPAALVVACDMPFLVAPLIHELLRLSGTEKIAVYLRQGFIEPFPGVYPKNILPLLTRALEKGDLSVQAFILIAPHAVLPEKRVWELDQNGLSFVNLNTLEAKERVCEG